MPDGDGLPSEFALYRELREVPGHGICGLFKFLFTTGLVMGITETGYSARYCYDEWAQASAALASWSGRGDPSGPWKVLKGAGVSRVGPGYR